MHTMHASNAAAMIQHIAVLLAEQSDQVLQEQLGIGMSQYRILKILQANPRLLQRHIADSLGQTEASISRQVKLLHEKQLITTHINPRNRREHITSLTPKGYHLTEAAAQVLQAAQAPLFNGIGDKHQHELVELLDRFRHNIFLTTDITSDY